MRRFRLAISPLLAVLLIPGALGQAPVLQRDMDKRPLPQVTMAQLSPGMRGKVQALISEAKEAETPEQKNRATPPIVVTTIYRIPVAPKDHRLYYIQQDGESACAPNGPNCGFAVYDETAADINVVVEDSGVSIGVVRRPNLQMPDIVAYDQSGHVSTDITVYRFNGSTWKPYLCNEVPVSEEYGDTHPTVLADKPCKP